MAKKTNTAPTHARLSFVIMPFAKEFKNQWELAFAPAIEDAGLRPWRGDEQALGTNIIMRDVTRSINEAEIIVADLTGRNPNVMYELGLAHAAKKAVIMLTQKEDDVPFDISHVRYLKYDIHDLRKLRKDLTERIINTLAMSPNQSPDFFPELMILADNDLRELKYLREKSHEMTITTYPPTADIFFNDKLLGASPQTIRINPRASSNTVSTSAGRYFEFHSDLTPEMIEKSNLHITLEPREREEYPKKVIDWLRSQRKYPNNPVLMGAISSYLIDIGEYEDALAEANELLELAPHWHLAHNQAGHVITRSNSNRLDKAANCFKHVVFLRPDIELGYFNLACVASLQNRFDSCIDFLRKIVEDEKILGSYCYSPENAVLLDSDLDPIRGERAYAKTFKEIAGVMSNAWTSYAAQRDLEKNSQG